MRYLDIKSDPYAQRRSREAAGDHAQRVFKRGTHEVGRLRPAEGIAPATHGIPRPVREASQKAFRRQSDTDVLSPARSDPARCYRWSKKWTIVSGPQIELATKEAADERPSAVDQPPVTANSSYLTDVRCLP